MENYSFCLPTKIFFGKGQVSNLAACIKPFGDKVLLVYGKDSIKKNGIYQEVVAQLNAAGIAFIELAGVDPNPRIQAVEAGAKLCRENDVKLVLGVGGGSVIDCSKGIAVAACHDGEAWDIWQRRVTPVKALPVGAVLTLAATASEANKNSVITNPDTEEKKGFGDEMLLPKFAIMDPSYTFTVPKKHFAAAIADTLAHVFEYYFIEVPEARLQDEFCEGVMRTVIDNAPAVMKKPDDYPARAALMWAASMALNGVISRGKIFDGVLHSVEHALSALYDISHGEGLAIIIPYWMEDVLDRSTAHKFARYARTVWGVAESDDMKAAKAGVEKTREFFASLELPAKLSDAGIPAGRFLELAEKSMRGKTTGRLKVYTAGDVVKLLEKMK